MQHATPPGPSVEQHNAESTPPVIQSVVRSPVDAKPSAALRGQPQTLQVAQAMRSAVQHVLVLTR